MNSRRDLYQTEQMNCHTRANFRSDSSFNIVDGTHLIILVISDELLNLSG